MHVLLKTSTNIPKYNHIKITQDNIANPENCIQINQLLTRLAFKFDYYDNSEVICKVNKYGISIKRFNLQLRKVITP